MCEAAEKWAREVVIEHPSDCYYTFDFDMETVDYDYENVDDDDDEDGYYDR